MVNYASNLAHEMNDTQRALLLKEQDELNAWTRVVAQCYFTWFTFFVTFNGTALALLFNSSNFLIDNPVLWRAMCAVFCLWSITATASSILVGRHSQGVDKRLKGIYARMYHGIEATGQWSKASGFLVPTGLGKAIFAINAFATFLLIPIWGFLAIFPPHARH
jgi:hypothetical protein